jgi:hypothetical protein
MHDECHVTAERMQLPAREAISRYCLASETITVKQNARRKSLYIFITFFEGKTGKAESK